MTGVYSFVKKLKYVTLDGVPCFIYIDNGNTQFKQVWKELRDNDEVIVQKYDMKMFDGALDTIYWFQFKDEGLTETYRAMVEL